METREKKRAGRVPAMEQTSHHLRRGRRTAPPPGVALAAFAESLEREGKSPNTVAAYLHPVRLFLAGGGRPEAVALAAWRGETVGAASPKTVNLRVAAMNKWLVFAGRPELRMRGVREGRPTWRQDCLAEADYEFLKARLAAEADRTDYFLARFLAATGARVSELVRLKGEHVRLGHMDILSKGGRARRVYIAEALRSEALGWMAAAGRESGFLFRAAWSALPYAERTVAARLRRAAERHGLDPRAVHPHAFRHLFARLFFRASADLPLLADLLGHARLDTTRVYLRQTAAEQGRAVDRAVTW